MPKRLSQGLSVLSAVAVSVLALSDARADDPAAAESTAAAAADRAAGPASYGQRGLLRTWSSATYPEGSFVLGSSVELSAVSDFLTEGDSNRRVATRLALAAVPLVGLEINAGFSMVMNGNSAFSPEDTASVGDPFLGVRYGYDLGPMFTVGGGAQLMLHNGAGTLKLVPDATSVRFVGDFDLRPVPELLIALNLGFHLDGSSALFDHELNEAQRFSAGINPHNQLTVGLGAAYAFDWVAPFVELGLAQAVGAGAPGFAKNPSWVTLGARAWPLDHRTLALLLAFDVGLGGVTSVPDGKARIPRWNAILGIAFDFGQLPTDTRVVEKVVHVGGDGGGDTNKAFDPLQGRVRGQVVDDKTGEPLPGARVVIGGAGAGILVSDPEGGRFATCPHKPGLVKLTVHLDGYAHDSQVVLVKAGEAPQPVTIRLKPSAGPSFGKLRGAVLSLTEGPVTANVSIPTRKIKFKAKGGKFERELETGVFDVLISSKGHVTQRRKINLRAGEEIILNVELYPRK